MEYEIAFRVDAELPSGAAEKINIPAFLRRLRSIRDNEMVKCPFCAEGSVSRSGRSGGTDVYDCDRCDARISVMNGARFSFG